MSSPARAARNSRIALVWTRLLPSMVRRGICRRSSAVSAAPCHRLSARVRTWPRCTCRGPTCSSRTRSCPTPPTRSCRRKKSARQSRPKGSSSSASTRTRGQTAEGGADEGTYPWSASMSLMGSPRPWMGKSATWGAIRQLLRGAEQRDLARSSSHSRETADMIRIGSWWLGTPSEEQKVRDCRSAGRADNA